MIGIASMISDSQATSTDNIKEGFVGIAQGIEQKQTLEIQNEEAKPIKKKEKIKYDFNAVLGLIDLQKKLSE